MNYAIHRISLDINDDSPSQLTVSARQGDIAKLLIISLLADKQNYVINEGCYATFTGKKFGGVSFEHGCTIDRKNNKIEYAFQPLTVSTSGRIDCEINIFNDRGERLTTSRFNIVVYETIFTGEISDAEDDITAVTQLRGELNALVSEVESKLANGEFVGAEGKAGRVVDVLVGGESILDLEDNIAKMPSFVTEEQYSREQEVHYARLLEYHEKLAEKVGFENYPNHSGTKAGVMKVNEDYGSNVTKSGLIFAASKSEAGYNKMHRSGFISKGTLENIKHTFGQKFYKHFIRVTPHRGDNDFTFFILSRDKEHYQYNTLPKNYILYSERVWLESKAAYVDFAGWYTDTIVGLSTSYIRTWADNAYTKYQLCATSQAAQAVIIGTGATMVDTVYEV